MKTVIGAEVKVEGLDKAGQSVGNFKKQLKEANAELVTMADKFGVTSKEAINAAKKVADLKDRIGDAKALADTFNPDKKFVALGGAIQGVTAGFSAMTGAMGLFGAQSKETEALLLKVQSAMALQQGISGIFNAIDGFKILANTIKTSVVSAFTTMRGALIATGIGAIGVVIGLVIANFDSLKKAVLNLIPGLAKVGEVISSVVNWFTDLVGATSDATRAHEKYIAALEKGVQQQQDLLDSDAGNYDEFTKRKLKAKIDYNKKVLELDKDETRSEAEKQQLLSNYADKANREIAQADADRKAKQDKDAQDKIDKAKAIQDKADAITKQQDEKKKQQEEKEREQQKTTLELKLAGLQKEKDAIEAFGADLAKTDKALSDAEIQRIKDNEQNRLETKQALAELALLEDPDSIDNKIAKENADFALEMANFDGNEIQRQVKTKEHSARIVQIKEEEVEAKKKLSELEVQQVQQGMNAISGALDAFAEVAGKQTAAGKALSIAATVIKTIQGGISAFMGMVTSIPGPVGIALGAVAAAGVVASGYASIAKMRAVQIPGKGGGSGGGSAPTISAPIIPKPQTTTLDQQSVNAVGNAANRAYVLETDVSGNQERIRRLNRASRIN